MCLVESQDIGLADTQDNGLVENQDIGSVENRDVGLCLLFMKRKSTVSPSGLTLKRIFEIWPYFLDMPVFVYS